jgi:protein TonB
LPHLLALRAQNPNGHEIVMSQLDVDKKPSRRLWIIAALGAVAIHAAGVALAVTQMASEESDDSLGAPAIEIGLEMSSPRLEATDLPPGPDTEASAASPAITEQKAVVKDTDLPMAVPTETEDPDRIVTENDSKKPKEEETEKAAVQQTASTESVAAEATATPTIEDTPEGASKAPVQGTGKSAQLARVTWAKELTAHLERHLRYPTVKEQKRKRVLITLVLDRVGHVVSAAIAQGSGDASYDEAALAMARRADPVPAPPPLVADEGLSFNLPVDFKLHGK